MHQTRSTNSLTPLDVIWEWARAEASDSRFHEYYTAISNDTKSALRCDHRSEVSEVETRLLAHHFISVRGALLSGLMRLPMTWEYRNVPVDKLAPLSLMRLNRSQLANTLGERVTQLETTTAASQMTSAFIELRSKFRPSRMRGTPILVGQALDGPRTIVEGNCRLAVIESLYRSGEFSESSVRCLVGTSPQISDWVLYQQGRPTNHRLIAKQ